MRAKLSRGDVTTIRDRCDRSRLAATTGTPHSPRRAPLEPHVHYGECCLDKFPRAFYNVRLAARETMASLPAKTLLAGLLQTLDGPAPLVILPHDNPDPHALASAAALKFIVKGFLKKDVIIAQGGIVGWAEN